MSVQLPLRSPAVDWLAWLASRPEGHATTACVAPLVMGDIRGPWWWAVATGEHGWEDDYREAWRQVDARPERLQQGRGS